MMCSGRDRVVPTPLILPVSATIMQSVAHRRGNDQVLELFFRPFMRRCADAWRFGPELVAPDGVRFNPRFDSYRDALPAWRYPDMTSPVEYLADVVRLTLERQMRNEAVTLRSLWLARQRVKQVLEGPDGDIDRIIHSVRDNGGRVSNKLAKEIPALADDALAQEVALAFMGVFPQAGDGCGA